MSDGFLARWSRRKRDEARRPAEAAPDATPVGPAEKTPDPDEGVLSSEELAQLPSLDALTAATDLTPFLRAGVPRALRNAALRRMWSIDPAIRDFVSEAREYAYDWNTPGGVPGTGGVISAEEVRAMVERVFGGGEEKSAGVTNESEAAGNVALSPSPRGRGEGCVPFAGDTASPRSEPQVRREGEGVFQDAAPPALPPQHRLPPHSVDEALSPPAAVLSGEGNGAGFPLPPPRWRVPHGVGRERGSATLFQGAPSTTAPPYPEAASPLGGTTSRCARSARHPPPQRGEGETRPTLSLNSPALAERGDAHGHREPAPEPELPPSPPRLRRHGGAIPI